MSIKFMKTTKSPTLKDPEDESSSMEKLNTEDNTAEKEERNFTELFHSILEFFMAEFKLNYSDTSEAIHSLKKSFKSYPWGKNHHSIDFNDIKMLAGYLQYSGAQGAGLVRRLVLLALKGNRDLKAKLEERNLDILSIGGGPGNDIVGFCSALYEFNGHLQKRDINLKILDSKKRWSSCVNLLEFYVREKNYGNISKLFEHQRVCMSFIHAEVPDVSDNMYIKNVREADIIIMSRVLRSMKTDDKCGLNNSFFQNMKPGALFLIVDSYFNPKEFNLFDVLFTVHWRNDGKSKASNIFTYEEKAEINILRKKCQKK